MKWYRKLYLGEDITKSAQELIDKIEKNAGTPGLYLITLSSNGKDLFDIFSTNELMQPVLHGLCPLIVGIAKGRDGAVELAAEIAVKAYRRNGDFDIERYLHQNMGGASEMVYEYPSEKLKRRKRFGFWKVNIR